MAVSQGVTLEAPEFPLAPLSHEFTQTHSLKISDHAKPKNLQFAILDFF